MMDKFIDFFGVNKVKFLLLSYLIFITYISLPFLGYDNPLEQAVEWVIKAWTGVDVELTPEVITEKFPL